MAEKRFTDSIGVSAIVRMRSSSGNLWKEGDIGMVIGQAASGRLRYQVMFPGTPYPLSPLIAEMELVQGVDLESWWQR